MHDGYFGPFGGRYVPEVLRAAIEEIEIAFYEALKDPLFNQELDQLRADFVGRPTPLLYAENVSHLLGGANIYIKMEGLAHTGAHKINNALGQALLARRMGKNGLLQKQVLASMAWQPQQPAQNSGWSAQCIWER